MRNRSASPGAGLGVQTLEKGLHLLDLVTRENAPVSLSALAVAAGLPLSTTHRLLSTMMRRGFVDQDPHTRQYRPGSRVVSLSAQVLQHLDLTREAPPVLQWFVDRTGDPISMATLEDGEVVPLCRIESGSSPRLFLHIGRRAPAHCTALGKVLLAGLPDTAVRNILARRGMPRLTPNTIVSPRKLLAHLTMVRELGYALDDEETAVGARCLAVPVRNHAGKVVAAISASGPASAWSPARMQRVREALMETAARLSARLGYRQPPARKRRTTGTKGGGG